MIFAVLRAELLRALPVLPWLLGLHALSLGMRTIWAARVSPFHEGLVDSTLWLLTAGCAIASVWRDHPRRRGAFLLSRPVRILPLFTGKATGLLIWLSLPFLVTELVTLAWKGMSPLVLFLGPLQMFFTVAVPILALFPLLWFWRTVSQAITGLLLAVAAGVLLGMVLEAIPTLRIGGSSLVMERLTATPSLLLASAAFGLLLAALGIPSISRKFLPRWLAFTTAMSVVILAITAFARREPPPADSYVTQTLVHATLGNREEKRHKARTWLAVEPPSPNLAMDEAIVWEFDRLRLNGEKAAAWPRRTLAEQMRFAVNSLPEQEAVGRHLHGRASFPPLPKRTAMVASIALPGYEDPTRSLDVEAGLRGTVIRWQVIADLPVENGATAESHGQRWTIERVFRLAGLRFQLREEALDLWLAGRLQPLPGRGSHRFFLFDEEKGAVVGVGARGLNVSPIEQGWRYPGRILRERGFHCSWSPHTIDTENDRIINKPLSGRYRIVVVRAFPVRTIYTSWKPSRPFDTRGLWRPADQLRISQSADPREGTAISWLHEHPSPGAQAPASEVSAWLAELAPRIGPDHPRPERLEILAAVQPLMPAHFKAIRETLEAVPGSSRNHSRYVFFMALSEGMTPELLRAQGDVGYDALLYQISLARGMRRELIPMAATRARQGFGWQVQEVLLSDPSATGLSDAEWHDFFKLYPGGETFRILAGKSIPRAEVEKEADRALEGYAPAKFDHDGDPLLSLALARGRSEAPRWLKSSLTGLDGAHFEHIKRTKIAPLIRDSFLPPGGLPDADVVNWFFTQDPDRFVFDPTTGKFQLP